MENKEWIVYMHITPSNKRYIGITSEIDPNKRWKNGYGYRRQIFYKAIQKYGWDSIEHIILAKGLNKKCATLMEKELIKLYHTEDSRYGYNNTPGGENPCERTPEIRNKISNSLKNFYNTKEGKELKEKIDKNK